ncbi:uncharacterized protein LOC135497375 [Lineus longissimus]|uniref:uncharacterized protein LOC135497375 n=1 Tax=Lineus longissimus TaxID=88925 RepID=UPI00315D4B55
MKMAARRAVYFLVLCSFSGLSASDPFHKLSDWLVKLENVIRSRQQELKPQKCSEELDLYKHDINLDTLKLVSGILSTQKDLTLGHFLRIAVQGYRDGKHFQKYNSRRTQLGDIFLAEKDTAPSPSIPILDYNDDDEEDVVFPPSFNFPPAPAARGLSFPSQPYVNVEVDFSGASSPAGSGYIVEKVPLEPDMRTRSALYSASDRFKEKYGYDVPDPFDFEASDSEVCMNAVSSVGGVRNTNTRVWSITILGRDKKELVTSSCLLELDQDYRLLPGYTVRLQYQTSTKTN